METEFTKETFKRALYEFLLQHDISLDSGIVDDLFYQLLGIESGKKDSYYNGFRIDHYKYDNDKAVKFTLPSNLTLPQLQQCLAFFQIPEAAYRTGKELVLDNKVVDEQLLPKFKDHFLALKTNNPKALAMYRIKSKALLEASAVSTLEKYINQAIDTILPNEMSVSRSINLALLIDSMLLLQAKVKQLRHRPSFYSEILNQNLGYFKSEVANWSEIATNPTLATAVKQVIEGLEVFARYHRNESVIANASFKKELTEFLSDHQITTAKCDVLEQTLLALAGAQVGPKATFQYQQGSDRSRLVFKFVDMTQENADKLISYCQKYGDETAYEGEGYRVFSGAIPESMSKSLSSQECAFDGEAQSFIMPIKEEKLEEHTIEVDAKAFYDHVYPKLKQAIIDLKASNPAKFTDYQQKSAGYFVKQTPAASSVAQNPGSALLFFKSGSLDVNILEQVSSENTASL